MHPPYRNSQRDFHPDKFSNGNLHMVDMGGIPKRFIQRIGKTQRHQVLHSLLAKIMIDAENLLFVKNVADRIIECDG